MKKKLSYKIYTLGCKVNQYDSGIIANILSELDFIEIKNKASLVIINTCAVTKTAISKAKRIVKSARRDNPKAKIFLCGCWPKVYQDEIDASNFDFVCGVGDYKKIKNKLKTLFQIKDIKKTKRHFIKTNKARYTIKIQDGCEQFCSYCIIPYTRGKLKSRPQAEILKEIQEVIKSGFQEIVLSGIHLGLYGVDISGKQELVNLIQEILSIKGEFRIRLSSIEVTEVSDELISLITENSRICKHLHIPLQAGSDKILRLMNRPYSSFDFIKKINDLRLRTPNIAITTDIIIGFPGEKEEDFLATMQLSEKIAFSKIHVFPFSVHEKTPAFGMKEKVKDSDIKLRADKLRTLGKKLRAEFKKKFIGQELTFLVEKIENDRLSAKSEYYFNFSKKITNTKKYTTGKLHKIKYLT